MGEGEGGSGGGQLRARRSNKLIPHVLIVLFCFCFCFCFVLFFFVALKCADDEFPCVTVCITKDWVCDNHDDCGDNADEIDCDVITGMYLLC